MAACGFTAIPGCVDEAPEAIPREKFVDAYIRLVRARIDAEGDSIAYMAARDEALRRAGVSASDLRRFVRVGGRNPQALSAAWQEIAAKLDTLYGGVTSELSPEMRRALGQEVENDDEMTEGEGPQQEGELGEREGESAGEELADSILGAAGGKEPVSDTLP